MNKSILVFGEDWGGHPSSSQHLITGLMATQQCPIHWVNSIGLRQPSCCARDAKRLINKLSHWFGRTTPGSNSAGSTQQPIKVIQPKTLPAPQSDWARAMASHFLSKQLQASTQCQHDIIWTSLPTAIDTINKLPHRGLVYYAGDDFGALAGVDHQTVLQREHTLLNQADLVIAASDSLKRILQQRAPKQRNIKVLPHGVDLTLFQTPTTRARDLPDHPLIAGFYGSLSNWIDQPLLCHVMQAMPHWQFVFVGQIETDIRALQAQPNFVHLPAKPHHQLPSYSQHWQAALLPFVDNRQIRACNPLKLREYLATGTPVVSTPFSALVPYLNSVHIADDAALFIQQLRAIEQKDPKIQQASAIGCELVSHESWQQRCQLLATWLEEL